MGCVIRVRLSPKRRFAWVQGQGEVTPTLFSPAPAPSLAFHSRRTTRAERMDYRLIACALDDGAKRLSMTSSRRAMSSMEGYRAPGAAAGGDWEFPARLSRKRSQRLQRRLIHLSLSRRSSIVKYGSHPLNRTHLIHLPPVYLFPFRPRSTRLQIAIRDDRPSGPPQALSGRVHSIRRGTHTVSVTTRNRVPAELTVVGQK